MSTLVPHHAAKDAEARPNLEVGDVVMELKDSKLAAEYSLAKVVKAEPSESDGLVRTVTLAALPKNILKKAESYDAAKCRLKPAAVQNLVLVATAREVEEKFSKFGEDETDGYYELEAAVPLEHETLDG